MSRFRPAPQRGVGKDKFANGIRILRIGLLNPFVFFERFLPFALPAFNRRNQAANFRVAGRQCRCRSELCQRALIILVDPISTLPQSQVRLGQIRLQTQCQLGFGERL